MTAVYLVALEVLVEDLAAVGMSLDLLQTVAVVAAVLDCAQPVRQAEHTMRCRGGHLPSRVLL